MGLDEEEVRSYVEELISQRDSLQKRSEHLAALSELAEKTIIEANNLAEKTKQKATDQAKADADKIRNSAQKEAEQILKQKTAEAKATAEKEAETLRAEILRHVELAREEQLNVLKAEAKVLAQRVQSELLASVDNVKKQITTIGTNFEKVSLDNNNNVPAIVPPIEIKDEPVAALSAGEKGALLDHIPWLEVEVMPPLDIEKIMELISRLESLPEVKTTDLLPETPNPLIRVFLNEPSPLAELLRTLPQVEKVTEMSDSNTSGGLDIQPDDKRERIQIVLGKNANIKDASTKKNATIKANS
jgi:cell division initiation protein